MHKIFKAYLPFIVYSFCIVLAYFVAFYLLPKYNEPLAYLGFLIIYIYIYCGVFVIGFYMGRITVQRLGNLNSKKSLQLALISFFIMLFIGSLKDIFTNLFYHFPITLSFLLDAIYDIDSLIVSIGTFVSFLIGETIGILGFNSNK